MLALRIDHKGTRTSLAVGFELDVVRGYVPDPIWRTVGAGVGGYFFIGALMY